MTTVQEIERAIERLTLADREALEFWFRELSQEPLRVAEPAAAYAAEPGARHMSADEYLELEAASLEKHEYVAGAIFALSGASKRHNMITLSLASAFRAHLRGGPCRAFIENVKVRLTVQESEIFYYPDVMVVCGAGDPDAHFVREPKLVVEVLSPSTATIDRREKALNYRHIASLEEYVLVAQHRPEVTLYRRADNWHCHAVTAPGAFVEFRSIALSLPLEQIYEDV